MKKSYSIIAVLSLTFLVAIAHTPLMSKGFGSQSIASGKAADVNTDSTVYAAPTKPATPRSVTDSIVKRSVVDQVIWVVGDEAILKSDVEAVRAQAEAEGIVWDGNPDFRIPEQIAVQKLFLNQAVIDSVEVTEAEIARGVEQQINYWIQMAGSREKLEEYKGQSITQMRKEMHDDFRDRQIEETMRRKIVEGVTVTPADVRRYFDDPAHQNEIPDVPTTVEVEIITRQPRIKPEEINRIKDELRSYTDRVTRGESSFSVLARLYSEDPGSARNGGELDYTGRGLFDPAFANVAFNLSDPNKISKIVETEFGFHIIQLIDKRGDKIKVRHILRRPKIDQVEIDTAKIMLDSLANEIRRGAIDFENAATYVSDDKDTKSNKGLMYHSTDGGQHTSRFRMQDLQTEIAYAIEKLQVGEISPAFQMKNQKGKTVIAIVKLRSRTPAHKATVTEDYQVMKEVVLSKKREEFLNNWIENKIKSTYTRLNEDYQNGDYQYDGWVK